MDRPIPWQHGDVLGRPLSHLPEGQKTKRERVNGRLIIMEGEATGHMHAIEEKGADVWVMDNGEVLLDVTAQEVTITHEEHKPLTIPRGVYQIGQVLEQDHFQDQIRHVLD